MTEDFAPDSVEALIWKLAAKHGVSSERAMLEAWSRKTLGLNNLDDVQCLLLDLASGRYITNALLDGLNEAYLVERKR